MAQGPVLGSRGHRAGRQAGGCPRWQCWGPRAVVGDTECGGRRSYGPPRLLVTNYNRGR